MTRKQLSSFSIFLMCLGCSSIGNIASAQNGTFNNLSLSGVIDLDSSVYQRIFFNHNTTGQSFAITTLSENNGFHGGGIGFSNNTASYPFWVFDTAKDATLGIREEGVGIGTFFADEPLHVQSNGFSPFENAKILVENRHSDTGSREMFALVNNGATRFTMLNTHTGVKWAFSQDAIGRFTISDDSTGGPEFSVASNGRVTMGPGTEINFDLRPNGNLNIKGTLTQSSDKNLKKNFSDVNSAEVLDKIATMPISTWQFKFDSPSLRHMGPTAQDFRAAFELGENDTTIAPVDGIGVSIAGIKALKEIADQKASQLANLQAKLEQQEKSITSQAAQLADQNDLIAQLSQRLEQFESTQTQRQ